MEENLHDDKLDDFVRKSFDDYEEDPPADMWDRVEVDLVPPIQVPGPRASYLRWGWKALAAGVILVLFSTLVCEHLYYEEKLRALSAKKAENESVLPQNKTEETASLPSNNAPSKLDSAPKAPAPAPAKPAVSSLSTKGTPQTPAATAKISPKVSNPASKRISKPSIAASKAPKSDQSAQANTSIPLPNLLVQAHLANEIANSNPNSSPNSSDLSPSITPNLETLTENLVSPDAVAIQYLPIRAASVLPLTNRSMPNPGFEAVSTPVLPRIQPVQKASGWYVGLQTSLLVGREIGRPPAVRPGRPAFANRQGKPPVHTLAWVQVGNKLNRHFSLETGLGYQKMTQKANHAPAFKFGEGFVLGSSLGIRRAFNYDLSTYGGTAEVSLRMEASPGVPPDDNEPVNLKISTEHRIELLRIPLLAKYQFGSKALHGFVKAGVLGNVVLTNELEIAARVSQNARFQPVSGSDGYTVQLDQKPFFLGFLGSAGLEYSSSKHLSWSVAPTFIGDFPRKDPYGRPLPQRLLVGINVGANYYF